MYFFSIFYVWKFQEYEKQESSEARYVKDLDRVDLLMQAFEYEKRDNNPGNLQEFFTATQEKVNDPFLVDVVKEINNQREALCKIRENDNWCLIFNIT